MESFLGNIQLFGFNFAPRGWALCNGQLLSIAQNSALFALLGTTYGGNGTTTFGLPDLRGRAPLGQGQGAGLTNRVMGELAGTEEVSLLTTQLPVHQHATPITTGAATSSRPGAGLGPAKGGSYAPPTTTSPGGLAGGGQPHDNLPPSLVANWCICTEGIFPSRN